MPFSPGADEAGFHGVDGVFVCGKDGSELLQMGQDLCLGGVGIGIGIGAPVVREADDDFDSGSAGFRRL